MPCGDRTQWSGPYPPQGPRLLSGEGVKAALEAALTGHQPLLSVRVAGHVGHLRGGEAVTRLVSALLATHTRLTASLWVLAAFRTPGDQEVMTPPAGRPPSCMTLPPVFAVSLSPFPPSCFLAPLRSGPGSPLAHRGSGLSPDGVAPQGRPVHLPGVAGRLCYCPLCVTVQGSCCVS